ncbi:hypothetical protein TgHK011_001035 [Trichoderma gracile]|nr:hypothetical protein TgHK011_001035 [Trichoderma gracile]
MSVGDWREGDGEEEEERDRKGSGREEGVIKADGPGETKHWKHWNTEQGEGGNTVEDRGQWHRGSVPKRAHLTVLALCKRARRPCFQVLRPQGSVLPLAGGNRLLARKTRLVSPLKALNRRPMKQAMIP